MTEAERTTRCNEMIRKICMREIRLADTFAYADGRTKATPADYYSAVMSQQEARLVVHRLYGEQPG
jgi:hypothetical protein